MGTSPAPLGESRGEGPCYLALVQRYATSTNVLPALSQVTLRLSRSHWTSVRLAAVALAVALFAALALPVEFVFAVARENGPLETLQTLLLFGLAAGVLLFRRRGEGVLTTGSVAFLLFAMGARELEWHKARIGGNVLKGRFYLSPATADAKLVAGVIVLLLATSAIYLVWRHGREAWNGLRRREPRAITAATFLVALMLSRLADKTHLGHPTSQIVAGAMIVEEMLELALPLLVLLGACQYGAARPELPETGPGVNAEFLNPYQG